MDRMNWIKLGLIFKPDGKSGWDIHSALTPTPVVFVDKIRVYAGFRDYSGISRIGFVDLNPKNPTEVIRVSRHPVLDIGEPGTFDDNGMILGDIINDGDTLKMYYVGFQLVNKVKFLAFTGLAISKDNGESFQRISKVPILDRQENALFINAVHTVIKDKGIFKFWLGAGSGWETINGIQYPSYNVKYVESKNGITFNGPSTNCLNFTRNQEYRIGRPRVYFREGGYQMIFTWGDLSGNYRMGYATSDDGKTWLRDDDKLNFNPSASGWDDKWVSYGSIFEIENDTYMVYNGNDMGKDGFGLARLEK